MPLFVGVQLRHSEKLQRANMHQNRADRIIGLLDALSQESNRRMAQNVFALPAARAWWQVTRSTLYPGLVDVVEREWITRQPLTPPTPDPYQLWRAALQEILRAVAGDQDMRLM